METNPSYHDAVNDWLRIPEMIEEAIAGLSAAELDLSAGSDAMSPRETVHHLVEANIVASSMIIAALGASGCTFDWSWLYPNTAWVKRMNYDTAPIDPALATLRWLCQHISNIVRAKDDALQCEVRLFDSPGAETYSMTVETILRHEVDHAEEHLLEIRKL
jgi:hypothetical protein